MTVATPRPTRDEVRRGLRNFPVDLPITHGGDFARRIGFAVALDGTRTTGVVRCDQPRVLGLSTRNGRKVEALPASVLQEVLARAITIFQ